MSRDEPSDSPAEAAEDFLYHLYRGSELLLSDQVHEAKGELERALALQPQDAKGQDLLAGVYFRLGVYPRAIEIWERLVRAYPRDATLKVNLALAMLKTGQHHDALSHITDALALAPDHEKAWGYLGLTYWRIERFADARDAFLRGGQAAMARRMEAVLEASAGASVAPRPLADVEPRPSGEEPGDRAAMRNAAAQAIEQFEAEQLPLSLAPTGGRAAVGRRGQGAWSVAEPGRVPLPRTMPPAPLAPNGAARTLETRLAEWTVTARDDAPLSVTAAGDVFVSVLDDVYCRLVDLIAVRGELKMGPVNRRARGQDLGELLGGKNPIMRLRGPVAAIVGSNEAGHFFDLRLTDDVLFLREDVVFAFDGRLGFESGSLPNQKEPVPLLSLHGSGVVVLRLPRPPTGVAVDEGAEVAVEAPRLLGWSGRLWPNARGRGTAPYSAAAPSLSFKGTGVVLIS